MAKGAWLGKALQHITAQEVKTDNCVLFSTFQLLLVIAEIIRPVKSWALNVAGISNSC